MPKSSRKPPLSLVLRCLAFLGAAGIAFYIYIVFLRPEPEQTQLPEIDFTQLPDLDFENDRPADDSSPNIVFPGDR